MARLVKIEGGVIVAVSIGDSTDPLYSTWSNVTGILINGAEPSIGWTFNGSVYAPPVPPPARKNSYTLAQWIDVLTDSELDAILDYVNGETGTIAQKRAARRVWEYWRANNSIDFNIQKNRDVLTWLVNNSGGIWTNARKN